MTNTGLKISAFKALWFSLFIVILDQLTKIWVRSDMTPGESRRVLGDSLFRLTFVENTGVAFGLQAGSPIFLALFSVAASVLLIFLLVQPPSTYPKMVRITLSLILGGAVGNLIDRVLFGRVTDFLDFDFPDFIMTRWPVFNVADSAVTLGLTVWCLYLVFSGFSKSRALLTSKKD